MRDALFKKGLKVRKEVLGAEYVENSLAKADRYTRPMQEFLTKAAWGLVWARPGLPRKYRSLLNLGMLVALNMQHELKLHIRAALGNGLTREEIAECVLQSTVYCGAPAALNAMRSMQEVYAAMDAGKRPARKKK